MKVKVMNVTNGPIKTHAKPPVAGGMERKITAINHL
jgi:hypothetical protein